MVPARVRYRKSEGLPEFVTTLPDGTLNACATAAAELLYAPLDHCLFHLGAYREGTFLRVVTAKRDACAIIGPFVMPLSEALTPYAGVPLAELLARFAEMRKRERAANAAAHASAAKHLRWLAEHEPGLVRELNGMMANLVQERQRKADVRGRKAVA